MLPFAVHHCRLLKADLIKIDLATVVHSEQPIFILFDCMRKSNLRIVDLFHAFDKDKSGSLTREELKEGLLVSILPASVIEVVFSLQSVIHRFPNQLFGKTTARRKHNHSKNRQFQYENVKFLATSKIS